MQALEPGEMAVVRAHLDTCNECRTILAQLTGDMALVGLSVPQEPLPEGARARFLASLDRVPQQVFSPAAPRPTPVPMTQSGPALVPRRRSLAAIVVPWAVAAAFAATSAWLGIRGSRIEHRYQQQLDAQREAAIQLQVRAARAQQVLDVLTTPDAQRVAVTEGKAPAQPIGHATYVPGRGALIFMANNLRPIPGNKTYELWLIPANGNAPIPAGLFRPDSTGNASVVLPPLEVGVEAKAFGVTIEDPQGSTTPTAPIVLSGS